MWRKPWEWIRINRDWAFAMALVAGLVGVWLGDSFKSEATAAWAQFFAAVVALYLAGTANRKAHALEAEQHHQRCLGIVAAIRNEVGSTHRNAKQYRMCMEDPHRPGRRRRLANLMLGAGMPITCSLLPETFRLAGNLGVQIPDFYYKVSRWHARVLKIEEDSVGGSPVSSAERAVRHMEQVMMAERIERLALDISEEMRKRYPTIWVPLREDQPRKTESGEEGGE